MDIHAEWGRIESAGPVEKGGWRAKRLPVLADDRHLVLAVDELGQRHLLVPQGGVELPSNTRSPLAVATREFAFDGDDSDPVLGRYLDIHCQVKTLNGQFDKVIADVVEAVQESRDAAAGAAATVASWRRLFTTLVDSPGLTYRQRLALFGELSVLRDLAETVPEFDVAWWTGPLGEPQDFRMPDLTMEVKTAGEDSTSVTIHGLEQLDPPTDDPVRLIIRRVVENPSGMTLSELFSQVLDIVADQSALRDRAAMVGVTDTDPDPLRFEISETRVGVVDDGFPRLRAADIRTEDREAISRVEYELDLARLRPHMAAGTVAELLEGR